MFFVLGDIRIFSVGLAERWRVLGLLGGVFSLLFRVELGSFFSERD